MGPAPVKFLSTWRGRGEEKIPDQQRGFPRRLPIFCFLVHSTPHLFEDLLHLHPGLGNVLLPILGIDAYCSLNSLRHTIRFCSIGKDTGNSPPKKRASHSSLGDTHSVVIGHKATGQSFTGVDRHNKPIGSLSHERFKNFAMPDADCSHYRQLTMKALI